MSGKTKTSARGVVLVTVVILLLFSGLFLLEFVRASQRNPIAETALTSDSYMPEVTALLENADAARGEVLVSTYECQACHIEGAGRIAPAYTGLVKRAATRRPPLAAAAYVYEAIINPGIFLAKRENTGKDANKPYPNSMPANYLERLTDQEMGDVIAYLLTQ